MADSQDKKTYVDIDELVARTGLSEATIWRLKRAGKIPFFQPTGKGGRVKFPEDAIELAGQSMAPNTLPHNESAASDQLPGPRPKWMSPGQNHKNK